MKALEEKLAARKPKPQETVQNDGHYQGQLAWRMVIELVAGLGIGFGIGYSLDRFLGTLPIFLVLFVFLGLAAGVKTMLQSAKELQKKQLAGQEGPTAKNEGDRRG
ncbi:AtpZ/AtpI family protein [Loktanella sp. DJP18]|uniref:AtpZ/AtpI family protein n=1 Tax=Loktanella sp. DJP18 TaxID=3409788 RepID=UPI003BB5C5CC